MHPVVRDIIGSGSRYSAADAFEGAYRLAECIRRAQREWTYMDVMLLPTAGTIYTIESVLADPIRLNSNLGAYTNFVNLMDLCAIAVPSGLRGNNLPFGVTLIGPVFADEALAVLADRLHRAVEDARIGSTGQLLPREGEIALDRRERTTIELAVVGAHLSGQPLNRERLELGASLGRTARTIAGDSLYPLAASSPTKPGLLFAGSAKVGVEVEVWALP